MTFPRFCPVFMALALFLTQLLSMSQARAAEQTNDEITKLLTTGQWVFQGKNWANARTFTADGTFHGRKSGNWKIENGKIRLIFADHEDDLILPLDPKGTKGVDANGLPLMATQQQGGVPLTAPPMVVATSFASVDPALKAILTQGQWYIQGMNWSNVREFKKDGTFTTQRNAGEHGTWTVEGGVLQLTFKSSAMDKIFLPINPKGSKGIDGQGGKMIALQQPLVEPMPDPVPPAEITPAMIEAAETSTQPEDEIKAMLVQGQWYFQGKSWANVRVFNPDGTFKGGGDGTWKIADGMVVVDSHGKQDNFILPVDPKGTNGVDSKGNPMIVLRQPIKPLPPKMGDVQTVNHSTQTDAMIGATLTQGQWHFQGRSWANTRVFRPDGTFYTQQRPGEGGTWKIIDGIVVLSFKSSENLLMLPIDTQLTIGQDPEGIPILVFQEPLSESEPTPAPTPIRPAKPQIARTTPAPERTPAAPFGTTNHGNPAPATPNGTPAYFGTKRPPDQPQ
jgi:hypothetical protein